MRDPHRPYLPRASRPGERAASERRRTQARLAALLVFAACARPLPEADSLAARVYAEQCNICHEPIQPGLLTPAMWEIQVKRMDAYRPQRGLPPLSKADRQLILEYLHKHGG